MYTYISLSLYIYIYIDIHIYQSIYLSIRQLAGAEGKRDRGRFPAIDEQASLIDELTNKEPDCSEQQTDNRLTKHNKTHKHNTSKQTYKTKQHNTHKEPDCSGTARACEL